MAENVGDIQEKEGDDFFLDLIRARRNFFSKESPDYKDSNVVQNAMQEISDIIGQPVQNCVAQWRRLKKTYFVKKLERSKETATGKGKKKPRQHFEHYERVKEIIEPQNFQRSTYTNITSVNSNQKSVIKKKTANKFDSLITSAFDRVNEGLAEATNFIRKEASVDNTDNNFNNIGPNELFRMLIIKELNQLERKKAKSKGKKLLKFAIDFDDESGTDTE